MSWSTRKIVVPGADDVAQPTTELRALLGVETCRRLVHAHQPWPSRQRPSGADQLALALADLVEAIGELADAEHVEREVDVGLDPATGPARRDRGEKPRDRLLLRGHLQVLLDR